MCKEMELAVECLTPFTVPQYSRSRIDEVMPSLESPSCSLACVKKQTNLKPHCCSRFGNRLLATPSFISTRLVALMQARHLEHPDITNRLLTDRVRLLTTSVRKTALCRLLSFCAVFRQNSALKKKLPLFMSRPASSYTQNHTQACKHADFAFSSLFLNAPFGWFYLWRRMKQQRQRQTPRPNCLLSLALLMTHAHTHTHTRAHTHAALRSTTAQRQVSGPR